MDTELFMKIDFYILNDEKANADWLLACRLIDKAYQSGHQIFILMDDQKQAFAFDELLWSYDPQSFIPHHIQGEGPHPAPPVQIGFEAQTPPKMRDVFINLSTQLPDYFKQFKRICEIVAANETSKQLKREHYRIYQKIQKQINTYQI
jgi:DNA polymerase-3 subunit chi